MSGIWVPTRRGGGAARRGRGGRGTLIFASAIGLPELENAARGAAILRSRCAPNVWAWYRHCPTGYPGPRALRFAGLLAALANLTAAPTEARTVESPLPPHGPDDRSGEPSQGYSTMGQPKMNYVCINAELTGAPAPRTGLRDLLVSRPGRASLDMSRQCDRIILLHTEQPDCRCGRHGRAGIPPLIRRERLPFIRLVACASRFRAAPPQTAAPAQRVVVLSGHLDAKR